MSPEPHASVLSAVRRRLTVALTRASESGDAARASTRLTLAEALLPREPRR